MDDEVGAVDTDVDIVADENGFEIAVIGMAGRFPGAANIDHYWDNLCNGVESISTFTNDELLASGVDPNLLRLSNFIKATGSIDGIEMFDAAFFKCSPREAKIMAPQHRLLLECAYEALQHAGYDAQRYRGAIGVFAGENTNSYARLLKQSGDNSLFYGMQTDMGNDREFLSTTISYKLGLSGPSLTIQTACSTSLSTVHMAYQSLLCGESDIALAGGITISVPSNKGYVYEKEGIMSPDGHCRAFDASAQGTVGGEGVGIVTLKRLEDALADGDCIHAVIKGSAMNNDGSNKVGFTAPSVEGQADVIARAQAMGEVEPDTVGYIETHGTGTLLGDPIEIAALTRAFRARGSKRRQYCAIGSVKTNIGHLDVAAGIAGLIKTILVLKNRQIPPSLHYKQANPQIDFASSPFYVSQELADWQPDKVPFRAGVSAFGIGGTNVHMVLEEPPRSRSHDKGLRTAKLLLLSATTDTALDHSCGNLAAHLKANPDLLLADVAFTLQTGRQQFQTRRMLVCGDRNDAITALEARDPKRVLNGICGEQRGSVVFMFPGQGAQYVQMGRDLYDVEPVFRAHFDECCDLLKPEIGVDLRALLYPSKEGSEKAAQQIDQTSLTQPALFAIEYSLARLWISWGVQPQAMIGHSIGEYVAACLAGVFSLPDALSLVSARAALMQDMEPGSMSALPMSADEAKNLLGDGLSVAAINEPSMCVVSGSTEKLVELEAELAKQGIDCRRLHTSHAFHSEMMDAVIGPFEDLVRKIEINNPEIPYISNLTGTWITPEEVADAAYWGRHLRNTVLFAAGLEKLFENPLTVFLEVGPGQTLSTLTRGNPSRQSGHLVISSMRHPQHQSPDSHVLLNALGRLWLGGIDIDWAEYYRNESRQRVVLPGYPFERKRYWVETSTDRAAISVTPGRQSLKDWFYFPSWMRSMPVKQQSADSTEGRWLIFCDDAGVADKAHQWLKSRNQGLIRVRSGSGFARLESDGYSIDPSNADDYRLLLDNLRQDSEPVKHVIHLWAVTADMDGNPSSNFNSDPLTLCYHSLIYLVQALGTSGSADKIDINVISNHAHAILKDDRTCPEKATLLGPCGVIGQEYPNLSCRNIDLEISLADADIEALMTEIMNPTGDMVVAYRNRQRWIKTYQPVVLDTVDQDEIPIRQGGVYLITGGLGGVGLAIASFLAQEYQARLVLTGRSELPPRECWSERLAGENRSADPRIKKCIETILALEDCGARVMVLQADVADKQRMYAVRDTIQQEFGEINGIVHAAGVPGGRVIQLQSAEIADAVMAPKVDGTRIVGEVFGSIALDFLMLCSSLSSILGAAGQVDYCSANAFQDAYADYYSTRYGVPAIAINWDTWNEDGMAVRAHEQRGGGEQELVGFGFSHSEGVEALKRILARVTTSQIAVSTNKLSTIMPDRVIDIHAVSETVLGAESTAATSDIVPAGNEVLETELSRVQSPADIEKVLCEMWQGLLGVEGIAADDNFYDLGGDSLLALQVTSRLRQSLLADLSVATVLESPTVRELTQRVVEQQQSIGDNDKATEMLQRIKSLSPEEKERHLAKARKAQSAGK